MQLRNEQPRVIRMINSGGDSDPFFLQFPMHLPLPSSGSPAWLTAAAGFHSRGNLDGVWRDAHDNLDVVKVEVAATAVALHMGLNPAVV